MGKPKHSKKRYPFLFHNHFLTLNSHGSYSDDHFRLPDNISVSSPHPNGLDSTYELQSPSDNITFEEMLSAKPESLMNPSSNGWRIYRPGDLSRNIVLNPWSLSNDTQVEFRAWSDRVPAVDTKTIITPKNEVFPRFAIVFARDSNKKFIIDCDGNKMQKNQGFRTDLSERNLKLRQPDFRQRD